MIVGGGDTNLEISRSLRSGLHYAIIFYSDVFRPDLESTQARLVSLYELVGYLCTTDDATKPGKRGSIKFSCKIRYKAHSGYGGGVPCSPTCSASCAKLIWQLHHKSQTEPSISWFCSLRETGQQTKRTWVRSTKQARATITNISAKEHIPLFLLGSNN